jgi:hypothetical protein
MKIYSNKIIFQNTKPSIDLSKLPDDIFLIIASFLNKKDKRNYKNINKFISNYYHKYLDISDTIIIACQRNNIEIIKQYFTVKEIQKLIFSNVIKNNYINIFNNLPLNNLYHETYETIITKSCVHNCYKIIEIVFNYIQSIPFDIIYVKNVFANRNYELFKLLYKLPYVYNSPLNSIFAEACALGLVDIINLMIVNPNINPMYNNNNALNNACKNYKYNVVKILIDSNRIDQHAGYYVALRNAIEMNNIEMFKILFDDNNLNINNLNLANIQSIINKPDILNYILNSNKIIYNFINTCIYAYVIQNNIDKIKSFVKHPKFKLNTLFPNESYGHIISSRIHIDNLELIDILLENSNNIDTIYMILRQIILRNRNKSFIKLMIHFVMNKINNNDYILSVVLDILSNNNEHIKQEEIYNIIMSYTSFFDTAYELEYYNICKQYIQFPTTNIVEIIDKFNHGKYKELTKMFLNYF